MRSLGKYPPSSRFGIGPLQIDLERGTVSGQDGAGGLTSRAEHLLLLLARYPNLLVTREQILETVWAGRVVEDAAITNCIWQIRKAIGERGKEVLQTRAKRGYVLAVADNDWILDSTASLDAEETVASTPEPELPSPSSAAPRSGTMVDGGVPADLLSVASAPQTSRWRARVVVAAVLLSIAGCVVAWQLLRTAPDSIALRPGVDTSVAVLVPDRFDWLRDAVLRDAVEYIHSRDGDVVLFQKTQTRNPFAGPHLQVTVTRATKTGIEADFSLAQGRTIVRERFSGPANRLTPAMHALLVRVLGPSGRATTPAIEAFVSGRVEEMRFDDQAALAEYRKAISREPGMVDARIAMARILFAQGRMADALRIIDALSVETALTASQRCRFDVLLASTGSKPPPASVCPRAHAIASLQRLELRDALRQLEHLSRTPMGAEQWLEEESATILALLRLQEWSRAEYEIARAEGVARQAGWEHARIEIDSSRGTLEIHRGRLEEAMRARMRAAGEMEALGDVAAAIDNRIWAIRPMQIVPGPEVARDRAELQTIIDRARDMGSVRAEIDALLLLARLDRDRIDVWRSHLARIRRLVVDTGLDTQHTLDLYYVMSETVFQQQYREALAGIAALEGSGNRHPRARAWSLTLRSRAYFARDELPAATAAIDAMEKEGLDVPGSVDFCFLSWMFVEADRPDRARTYLKRCRASDYDRAAQALRADFGVLAEARLHQRYGEPERAWPTLQPRIDALLGLPVPTREEAESLALLARHATTMPGADRDRLQRALAVSAAIAARDGAGPKLRLGTYLLRWRLCAADGGDCGPVLPPWAPEEHLEQRLAVQIADRQRP
jgi:DNA-binding winged helix-turn-helix (wHTH) protein/tetratricopeptide (TPR) repeat protein